MTSHNVISLINSYMQKTYQTHNARWYACRDVFRDNTFTFLNIFSKLNLIKLKTLLKLNETNFANRHMNTVDGGTFKLTERLYKIYHGR